MFNWDEKAVETTRANWKEGRTASEIAALLGGKITRNAVIGKLHRLGLTKNGRKSGMSPKRRQHLKTVMPEISRHSWDGRRKRPLSECLADRASGRWKIKADREKANQIALIAKLAAEPDVARVSLLDLEPHHCRWPVGEPVAGFCGCDKVPGLSYCAGHAARAFATPTTNRQTPQPTANNGINAVVAVQEFLAEASA
jgi:GcrA cell cycle regulator